MARLSTHVLDTAHGRPARGMSIRLYCCEGETRRLLKTATTNQDGRTDGPLLSGEQIPAGVYELIFCVADYFGSQAIPFLGEVVVRFGVEDPAGNYHVPLLVAPYGYSTYKGS
ncbi:MAG: hydroxyisourate hydrolase [Acidobacteriia bacterium]|nr:hydroxyisourate hydrolase [Terriglobia bacterium]